jgi:hypothetical protein
MPLAYQFSFISVIHSMPHEKSSPFLVPMAVGVLLVIKEQEMVYYI